MEMCPRLMLTRADESRFMKLINLYDFYELSTVCKLFDVRKYFKIVGIWWGDNDLLGYVPIIKSYLREQR